MGDHPPDRERSGGARPIPKLRREAKILRSTLRKAIRSSPESFLMTTKDVDAKTLDYWMEEIQTATWVVAQRDGRVIGVVAGKHPDADKDTEDGANTRYIESLWVSPEFRGRGLAEQLIINLVLEERRKSRTVTHFLLWVFETNLRAIRLYENMGFALTPEKNEGIKTEIKYRLDLDAAGRTFDPQSANEAGLRQRRHRHGVIFRVLGDQYYD